MNKLFEAFVRNFYRIEQKQFPIVKREIIKWNLEYNDEESHSYLPEMETDITLINAEKKLIIDAKYYRQTMILNYEKEKIHSGNLYQLFSYLLNQEDGTYKSANATGILLYPTIDKEYNLEYRYKEHPIFIKTVNLNSNWKNIRNRLMEIVQIH